MCNAGLIMKFSRTGPAYVNYNGLSVPGVKEGDHVLLAYLDGDEAKTFWVDQYVQTDDEVFFKTERTFQSTETMTFIIARTL